MSSKVLGFKAILSSDGSGVANILTTSANRESVKTEINIRYMS